MNGVLNLDVVCGTQFEEMDGPLSQRGWHHLRSLVLEVQACVDGDLEQSQIYTPRLHKEASATQLTFSSDVVVVPNVSPFSLALPRSR
jgi:hypothetical protein